MQQMSMTCGLQSGGYCALATKANHAIIKNQAHTEKHGAIICICASMLNMIDK